MKKVLALVALVASPVTAQEIRDSVKPELGSPAIASVGDSVYEKSHYTAIPAYEIDEGFRGKNIFATVVLSPGDKFIRIPSKHPEQPMIKACRSPSLQAFASKLYDACLYDDDANGTFDRFGGNELQGGKQLPHPFAYKKTDYVEPTKDALKQVVIYLGSTKDTLRLSYREFINDMARPAFTEEYTFPLGAVYPQTVAFKGVKLKVASIDGEGIHYMVEGAK